MRHAICRALVGYCPYQRQPGAGLRVWITFLLHPPLHQHNSIAKYEDDTHLLVPASAWSSVRMELDRISLWAKLNNLRLNKTKSREMLTHECWSFEPPLPPMSNVLPLWRSLELRSWALRFDAHHGDPQRILPFHVCTPHFMISWTIDNCTPHYVTPLLNLCTLLIIMPRHNGENICLKFQGPPATKFPYDQKILHWKIQIICILFRGPQGDWNFRI